MAAVQLLDIRLFFFLLHLFPDFFLRLFARFFLLLFLIQREHGVDQLPFFHS